MKIETTKYDGIFFAWKGNRKFILTKNLTKGKKFFDEYLFNLDNEEYREFSPNRSKLGAAIIKRISQVPIHKNDKVLYLGAAHGYTSSYVSDIVGNNGIVFCVEFAPRVTRDLYLLCLERENMMPILANANKPDSYKDRIEKVDIIFQDIAQKNQVDILFKNLQFLKNKGFVLFAVKARSIDVTKKPLTIYKIVREQLKEKLKILDEKTLDPLEKDHIIFLCQKK